MMFSRWKNNNEAAAFDQLWDQLQEAEGSRPTGANERPADAETIEAVLAHDDAPAIDPIFSATLLKDLTNMHAQRIEFGLSPNGHGPLGVTTERNLAVSQPRRIATKNDAWNGAPRMRLVASLAMVAVLLALGAFMLRPEQSRAPAVIPAAVMQESGGVTSETLMDISFPPGRMRGDDGAQVVFGEHLIRPGSSLDFRLACDSYGIYPLYVLEGTMTGELATPSFVLRDGASSWESVAAGETVEIHPGDMWYYENVTKDGITNVRNDGSGDVRFIWAGGRQNAPVCDVGPPSGLQIVWSRVEDPSDPIDPTQPVRYVLRTVTIAPGGEMSGEIGGFPIPTEAQEAMGARQWYKILSGQLTITRETAGADAVDSKTWVASQMATQDTLRSSEDETVTVSNPSDTPVELMVLDIVVGDPGAQGGIAAPPAASAAASS